jgi:hypothetical protein
MTEFSCTSNEERRFGSIWNNMRRTVLSTFPTNFTDYILCGLQREAVNNPYVLFENLRMGELIVLFVLGIGITNYDLFPHESNTLTTSLSQTCVIFTH